MAISLTTCTYPDHELVHRNREALVQQLYNSEHAYLESLQLVANIFLNPMRKDAKQTTFSFLGMKKAACTERELRWLFGNFDQILQVQRDILTSLEQRYSFLTQCMSHFCKA